MNQLPPIDSVTALENLRKISEAFSCDGPTRDVLRESIRVLSQLIPIPAPPPNALPLDPAR